MTRLYTSACVALCLALLAGPAAAKETHEESLEADKTQESYTRKSITFVGTAFDRGVRVPKDVNAAITKAIRRGIELKRFDYNAVDIDSFGSLEAFVKALREYVKKRSMDRAAAEAEWQDKFSSARVYLDDINRVMDSAYLYQIVMTVYRSKGMICPSDAKTAARLGCAPGVAGIQSTVNAEIFFYKANLRDEKGPTHTQVARLRDTPGKGFTPFDVQPPPKPRSPRLPSNASDAQRRDMRKKYQSALNHWNERMAEYNRRMPELKRKAEVKAAEAAVAGGGGLLAGASLVNRLSMLMKKIPAFQLKTPVQTALSDGVNFMLGKGEGLELDDTYEITWFDTSGQQGRSGWVKVRDIGDATGSGEGTPSYAEKVSVSRKFVGGELMLEYPMLKLDVGLHGVVEFALSDLVDELADGSALYFGAGAYILYDIGPAVGWPDFWAGIEFDYLAVGETANGDSVGLVHAMLGIKKRWYINSLVLTMGLRGGISYYSTGDQDQEDTTLIGGGGDLVLGVEYYVHPMFSVYLNVAGRFFSNPMQFLSADADPEMGGQANLGIRLGL